MRTHARMCDYVCVAGTLLPCREVLIASGQLSAVHLCQNSCAGQELKELKSLIAIASRNPLSRNNYTGKIPFSLTLFTLWCILYTSTKCTLVLITASKASNTLLQKIP